MVVKRFFTIIVTHEVINGYTSGHSMGGIDEKHGALPGPRFGQPRLDLLLEIGRLGVRVGLGRDHPHPATAQLEFFFRKTRTWLALRRIPVKVAIACCAALIVAGGWA